MHSEIFQISKEPINKPMTDTEFLATDCDYTGGGFVGIVADYVSDMNEKEQLNCIKNFVSVYKNGIDYNAEEKSFVIVDKKELFKEDFHKFSNVMEGFDMKTFMNNTWADKIQDILSPRFGWYVYTEGMWEPGKEFLRSVKNKEKYYFGSVLDYHF